jgi:RpiR family carbohydrate utilization transcriptional regulator
MDVLLEEHTLLHRISGKLPYLAPSLRLVGETILKSPRAVQSMTISELAIASGVAESTVSRFVRELGIDSYKNLLRGVTEALFVSRSVDETQADSTPLVYEGVARDDSVESIVGKIERSSIQALRRTAQRQDVDALARAVGYLDQARTVIFVCMGSSSIAAEEAVMRFTRAGLKCLLFRDQSIQVMLASILDREDVLVAISDSGQSTSVIQALRLARTRGAKTIAITSNEDAPLVEQADVTLFTSSVPSGGELYGESVTSKWGQILVIDILYAAYAAGRYDATVHHLEETYQSGIKHSRTS